MFFPEPTYIANLYDSHVHWLYTGQIASLWNLKTIQDPRELLLAEPPKNYLQGNWLVGFGWDENHWPKEFKPHREFLDQAYPETPVLLSRTDGHSSWVNTKALKILGIWEQSDHSHDIEVDENNRPTGILREAAHMQALFSLPPLSSDVKKSYLRRGAEIFNRAGFTHIRDMTSNLQQWQLHQEIQYELLLHVEHWFSCENLIDLQRVKQEAIVAKASETTRMKIRGLKVFFDGSLGSETAFLSSGYNGSNNSGQLNWSEMELKAVFKEAWQNQLEVAVHSIGDEAAHRVVSLARQVYSEGIMGRLHLEHAEILRPETIQMMKSLHIRCHLQPCHWFSDSKWLTVKLGHLADWAFPWQALSRAQIPMSFGSDSPIESSNFISNLKALQESSRKGIPNLKLSPIPFHQYPYLDAPTGSTRIVEDHIQEITFEELKTSFT